MIRRDDPTEFGKNLYKFMKAKQMSSKNLADIIGSSEATVSHVVNSRGNPSLPIAIRIAAALDVSLDDLCGLRRIAGDKQRQAWSDIAADLLADCREIYGGLQRMNNHARALKRCARKYRLIEEDEE